MRKYLGWVLLLVGLIGVGDVLAGHGRERGYRRDGVLRGGDGGGDGGGGGFTNTLSTEFDGVDEYASLADTPAMECNAADAITTCAWIYPIDGAAARTVWEKNQVVRGQVIDSGATFTIRMSYYVSGCNVAGRASSSINTFAYAQWHHVCWALDATSMEVTLYVDGAVEAHDGTEFPNVWNDCASGWVLASIAGSSQMYRDNLDEVYTWCEYLDATELGCVYNGGDASFDASGCADTEPTIALHMGDDDTHPTLTNRGSGSDFTLTNSESADFVEEVP